MMTDAMTDVLTDVMTDVPPRQRQVYRQIYVDIPELLGRQPHVCLRNFQSSSFGTFPSVASSSLATLPLLRLESTEQLLHNSVYLRSRAEWMWAYRRRK